MPNHGLLSVRLFLWRSTKRMAPRFVSVASCIVLTAPRPTKRSSRPFTWRRPALDTQTISCIVVAVVRASGAAAVRTHGPQRLKVRQRPSSTYFTQLGCTIGSGRRSWMPVHELAQGHLPMTGAVDLLAPLDPFDPVAGSLDGHSECLTRIARLTLASSWIRELGASEFLADCRDACRRSNVVAARITLAGLLKKTLE